MGAISTKSHEEDIGKQPCRFATAVNRKTAQTSDVSKIASANAQFASKFYEILSKEKPGENIFFSPLSAHAVLSLVYQGAAGTTAQHMAAGLNVPDKLSTAKEYNGVMDTLNNVKNVTLHVANKIFVMDNYPLKAAFRQAASELFLSEAQSVNFAENEKSAGIINRWVEDKTNSKIKDLIEPKFLGALTRLVLVNAVYFKGNWADKFDKTDTKSEPFYVTKTQKVDCQMMHITEWYKYRKEENLEAKILEIPYDNRDVSMVVILPNAVDGIEDLEKNLVNFDLSKLTEGMYESEVELSLPRFKMETDMDLESVLTSMGMGEIFDPDNADFSEISDRQEQLYVSKAVQKAFIEVNEEGAEAAAATVLISFLATNISITMATSEVSKIASGNVQFASKFYEILSKENPGENIFFSPLSAHAILSLAYQGAAGTTAQHMAVGLNLPDKLSTAKGYNGVIDTLNHVENVTLHVANKVFVMDKFPLKAAFRQAASDLFLSEAQSVNFAESEKSAGIINQWVEDKTNSKIKDLIKADFLNSLTRLVLVNAVYFKGNWADKFDKADTATEPFYVTKDQKVDCQMMHITKKYNYREDETLKAKILEIPYDNRDVSMVVILPNAVDGIEDLEKNLVNYDLSKLTEEMYKSEVELSLPRFKMETNMDLESVLTAMGMGEIFDQSKADFSEISDSPEQIYVSKAVQKAFIEVNEEGAEAAAATGIIMMARCMPIALPRVQFVADHPFVIALILRQSSDEHILFLGKVNNVN